jgi:hypothetical protein
LSTQDLDYKAGVLVLDSNMHNSKVILPVLCDPEKQRLWVSLQAGQVFPECSPPTESNTYLPLGFSRAGTAVLPASGSAVLCTVVGTRVCSMTMDPVSKCCTDDGKHIPYADSCAPCTRAALELQEQCTSPPQPWSRTSSCLPCFLWPQASLHSESSVTFVVVVVSCQLSLAHWWWWWQFLNSSEMQPYCSYTFLIRTDGH